MFLSEFFMPAARTRQKNALTLAEREDISRDIASGSSIRQISRDLRRAPSTVSREIHHNGGLRRYRAIVADESTWDQARRPKLCCLAQNSKLRRIVSIKLAKDWSPEQIAGWLKRTYPDEETLHVSHETIYKSLFIQSRGVLKKELQKHLRTKRVSVNPVNTTPVALVGVKLSMEFQLENAHLRFVTGRYEDIGKGILSLALPTQGVLEILYQSFNL